MTAACPRLDPSWLAAVGGEFGKDYMKGLKAFLESEISAGQAVCPLPSQFFAAMDRTPLAVTRAVILGQDPYHGRGQAHGLSFSVQRGVPKPPSLRNIFTELKADTGVPEPAHGCLEAWADQGVLLLNSVLSVRGGAPASHANRGWEQFTDAVIRAVNCRQEPAAFILWGAYARKKAAFVDRSRHFVVESPHPSPYSANSGFFGSRCFSKVNAFLASNGSQEIDWRVA
jgi:uracil-DNA glycosylase